MAEVIMSDIDPNIIANQVIHLQPDFQAQQYFQENFQNFVNTVNNLASNFVNKIQQTYNYINNNPLVQKAKEIITKSSATIFNDRVYRITEDNIFNAGYLMREMILANPILFNYYNHNRLSGWDDMVYLPEQNIAPEWRDDYLNTVDGIMMFDEDENGIIKHVSLEEDNPFSIAERFEIQNAWDVAVKLIAKGEDPTSPRD